MRAIQTRFPANFSNGYTSWNIVSEGEYIKDKKGWKGTVVARDAKEALTKFKTDPKYKKT